MEKEYIRSVIILIGGAQLPGEHFNQYLLRVSAYVGIGYDTVRAAYYGTAPLSKSAKEKFEWAAQHVAQTNELLSYAEHHLNVWQKDPARHRSRINATRRFLDDMRRFDEIPGGVDIPAGPDDVAGRAGRAGGEAAAAGLAAATAAATATS